MSGPPNNRMGKRRAVSGVAAVGVAVTPTHTLKVPQVGEIWHRPIWRERLTDGPFIERIVMSVRAQGPHVIIECLSNGGTMRMSLAQWLAWCNHAQRVSP